MTQQRAMPDATGVVTIYCPQCGMAMRVAPGHIESQVACPHCAEPIEPWRFSRIRRAASPPLYPQRTEENQIGLSQRSRIVAGLLGIFLGGFGVHRFYLGHYGIGVIQLIVWPLTGGVSSIWGLVEGILCLTGAMTDVDGRTLRD